jgi:hypothetical protein
MVPLPNAKQIEEARKALLKLGQASVTVIRVGHASDRSFSDSPPHCRITLTATDPADAKFARTVEWDLTGTDGPENAHTFVINVKDGFKFWRKSRKLKVRVVATPNQGFEGSHEPMTVELDGVVAGNERQVTVSLKPKPTDVQPDQRSGNGNPNRFDL